MAARNIGYSRMLTGAREPVLSPDVRLDERFEDLLSGKATERPALQACLAYLQAGDTLHVPSLDRLAWSLSDLRILLADLLARGVRVRSHEEALTLAHDDPMAEQLLTILGVVSNFERALLAERQQIGIEKAKQQGVYKGRAPSLTPAQVEQAKARLAAGEKIAPVARSLGVSRPTLYRHLALAES